MIDSGRSHLHSRAVEKLGEGGMAAVLTATDVERLEKGSVPFFAAVVIWKVEMAA